MDGKKVAGIITDAILDSDGLNQVVLGVGVNYDLKIDEIKKSTKRDDVAVLKGTGLKVPIIQKFLFKFRRANLFYGEGWGQKYDKTLD